MGGGGSGGAAAAAAAGAGGRGGSAAGAGHADRTSSTSGSATTPSSSPCKKCGGHGGKRPAAWSRSPPSSPVSAVLKRLLQLRASLLLPQHDPHISSSPSSPTRSSNNGGANLALLLRAGVTLMFGALTLLMSLQAFARRRAARAIIVYASPTGARVTGSVAAEARAGQGVMGMGDCIPADIMLGGRMGPSGDGKGLSLRGAGDMGGNSSAPRPIPMVATNLDFDTERYLTRWLSGLDFPATHTLVAWGGCDPLVAEQVEWALQAHPHVNVYRARQPLGCAGGWNAALQYMATHDDVPWAIVFNNDMYTPPGALEAFAAEIWEAVESDPTLCLGHFTTEGAGHAGRYTAYVYTRHALNTLGLVDANLYPAYYEDVELDIRVSRAVAAGACSPIKVFTAARFVHGREGQRRYVSGSKLAQKRLMAHGDEAAKAAAKAWAERIRRGKLSSPLYLAQKWGCDAEANIHLSTCRFTHPFDDPSKPLSYWELDAGRRRCIDDPGRGLVACPYTLEGV